MVPELDEDGNPISSDSKTAVTLTAFAVGAGAVALRIGGRAALMTAVGLDFANDNPELKDQLENILTYADSVDGTLRLLLFFGAWTAVKVLCFDAFGVVLALSSGIIFGGVFKGAFLSALAATVGSTVCFGLAKLDTPVRKKALEVVEEYPSLRGIEKVVAKDGFKAILTLRLAPVLPIPLGLYNYVYGVTNVPFLDFFAGIFLGSMKPYLLDSYLGYFGKSVIDGSAATAETSFQDIILLLALGFSVLIGVFASQLAGETWDTVLEEVETERLAMAGEDGEELDDEIRRELFGFDLPEWAINLQVQFRAADERMRELVDSEIDAKVWNYTNVEPPQDQNPALATSSPEVQGFMSGLDLTGMIYDGMVLSPILMELFGRVADPLYDEEKDFAERPESRDFYRKMLKSLDNQDTTEVEEKDESGMDKQKLVKRVKVLKEKTQRRLKRIEDRLDEEAGRGANQ